jgi:hypothetical protein
MSEKKEEPIRMSGADATKEKIEVRKIAEPRQKLSRVLDAGGRARTIRVQFQCDEVFHESKVFQPAQRDYWQKCIKKQAEIDMFLENPFLIRRIIRFEKIKKDIGLVCELPDKVEPVTLPYWQVGILQPKLLAKFLTRSEALIGPD